MKKSFSVFMQHWFNNIWGAKSTEVVLKEELEPVLRKIGFIWRDRDQVVWKDELMLYRGSVVTSFTDTLGKNHIVKKSYRKENMNQLPSDLSADLGKNEIYALTHCEFVFSAV